MTLQPVPRVAYCLLGLGKLQASPFTYVVFSTLPLYAFHFLILSLSLVKILARPYEQLTIALQFAFLYTKLKKDLLSDEQEKKFLSTNRPHPSATQMLYGLWLKFHVLATYRVIS